MLLKFITALLIGTAVVANARIGDSPDECSKRYGAVVESDPDAGQIFYSTGSLIIQCRFTDGKCDVAIYDFSQASLVVSEDFEKRIKFTQEQSARLLNLNGSGSVWRQINKESFGEPWHGIYQTADGKMHARLRGDTVSIETIERYKQRLDKFKDAEVEKALASIGANASQGEPKPTTGKFPPTAEEQEQIDLNKQLETLEKSISKPDK
jgi:hypothetical protein